MSKLSREEDRDKTRASDREAGGSPYVKLEEGHNFILLLSEDYEEGFNHWLKIKDKNHKRACAGGLEAKGWALDECDYCDLVLEQYEMKKAALDEGDKKLAEEYNTKGNKLRAGYAAVFPVVKFKSIVEKKKVRTKKGKVKIVKMSVPDYDEYVVGKLSLSHTQITMLMDIVDEEKYDRIESGLDLLKYALDFYTEKPGKKKYAELKEIIPSKRKVSFDVEDKDLPDVSKEFDIKDDAEKIIGLYKGEVYDEDEEDEYIEEELDKEKSKKGKKGKSKKKVEEDDEDTF